MHKSEFVMTKSCEIRPEAMYKPRLHISIYRWLMVTSLHGSSRYVYNTMASDRFSDQIQVNHFSPVFLQIILSHFQLKSTNAKRGI